MAVPAGKPTMRFEEMGGRRAPNLLKMVQGAHLPGYIDAADIKNVALLLVALAAIVVVYSIVGAAFLSVCNNSLRRLGPRARLAAWPFVALFTLAHLVLQCCTAIGRALAPQR